VIIFENIGVRYGIGPEILSDVSFRLQKSSFHFLTGPSGAGKTTLLKLMFLSLKPTRGFVSLFSRDAGKLDSSARAAIRRRIGIVFQDFRLLDHLTIYENVALPLRVAGDDEARYRPDVIAILEWVGLGDRLHAFPPILSGGEKQRAAIARAVITKPALLLADEPTGNVDPDLASRLLYLFLELNKIGTAVVLATHDHHLIEGAPHAGRLVLSDGGVTVIEP
jgi:cell division transport system ATP-binding protein